MTIGVRVYRMSLCQRGEEQNCKDRFMHHAECHSMIIEVLRDEEVDEQSLCLSSCDLSDQFQDP